MLPDVHQVYGVFDMPIMRLAYASEATFEPSSAEQGVEPNVARILMASRRNNGKCELVGGLYYGDNRFFQYLEGEQDDVRTTYERIKGDSRHRNITKLIDEPLKERTFSNWSMKYVPLSTDVRRFLASHNLDSFDPASFTPKQCEEMIDLVRSSSQKQEPTISREGSVARQKPQAYFTGRRIGLRVAAACLVAALIFVGTIFLTEVL
jgi:hypothetical protein